MLKCWLACFVILSMFAAAQCGKKAQAVVVVSNQGGGKCGNAKTIVKTGGGGGKKGKGGGGHTIIATSDNNCKSSCGCGGGKKTVIPLPMPMGPHSMDIMRRDSGQLGLPAAMGSELRPLFVREDMATAQSQSPMGYHPFERIPNEASPYPFALPFQLPMELPMHPHMHPMQAFRPPRPRYHDMSLPMSPIPFPPPPSMRSLYRNGPIYGGSLERRPPRPLPMRGEYEGLEQGPMRQYEDTGMEPENDQRFSRGNFGGDAPEESRIRGDLGSMEPDRRPSFGPEPSSSSPSRDSSGFPSDFGSNWSEESKEPSRPARTDPEVKVK
ncbi:uncharacterized protein LOC141854070 [Brevipalpus obovatus]|uniref:uncharacterized protein LOC141854070 n=1 Tax=Brevipalpus obovatus TaxID=246614 RepID=UPI003D9DF289